MNHCVRLLLLFTPSLIALALLGIAFATHSWTIALEKNIPRDTNALNISASQEHLHTTLVRVPLFRGLFSECVTYRNVPVVVPNSFDFRPELTREQTLTLANQTCNSEQFQCRTGVANVEPLTRCIDRRQQCNRLVDCEDKSDELSCQDSSSARDNAFPQCSTGFILCQDGLTCYRENGQTCDGVSNCIDNSDEKNCDAEKCQRNQRVFCPREGQCSRRANSRRCDGIVDCADHSDEDDCDRCQGDPSVISCDSKCLPGKYRCDGIVQCSDLRDESNCGDYASTGQGQQKISHKDQSCMEQRFNPFRIYPYTVDSSLLDSYSSPNARVEHLKLIFFLQLAVFYGIFGGLIFLLLAVITLFFFGCCRRRCVSVPFYFYGLWMLFAWLLISTALVAFVFQWLWQKQTVLDADKSLPVDVMIHESNPNLRNLEFFGLSFWLACGAALATFLGLLLSYCVCCTVGSSRADDKEYEIMQMHNY